MPKTKNSHFLTALNQKFLKISKNLSRILIQKSFEFHLLCFEISQLLSCILTFYSQKIDFYTLNNIRVNKVYHYHCLQTKQSLCSMYNKQKALQKKLSHWVRFFVVWVMDERFILKPTSVKIFFCSRGSKLRGNFDANFKIACWLYVLEITNHC